MGNTSSAHLDQVNSSGFLYQVRIGHEVQSEAHSHGWELKCSEYRWSDPDTGEEEFIDLILKRGNVEIVIECKRVSGGSWIFLVPNNASNIHRTRVLWAVKTGSGKGDSSWDDVLFNPQSLESNLCVMPGKNERDKPLLERTASKLVRSAEAISRDEFSLPRSPLPTRQLRIYIPVIVTNAQIQVCRFDPERIDLSSGLLSEGNFQTVPFVRFRKTLSTGIVTQERDLIDIADLNGQMERTIFVINGSELNSFLASNGDRFYPCDEFDGFPWQAALRALESASFQD